MIPLKLTLHNFLSYRQPPPLDFAGLHIACLCGANGHGKSALLDGITWALWGQARGSLQDEVIAAGADECRVELEFAARNQRYRVTRLRRRGRNAVLELALLDAAAPRPLTGNVMRETQQLITQTVGMDYETFVNSALLVQGRAGEFTNRTPGQRKEVLGKILGLEEYDRLQTRARRQADDARTAQQAAESTRDRLRQDLERLGDPARELTAVESQLQQSLDAWTAQREQTAGLRRRLEALRQWQEQQEETRHRLLRLSQELEQLIADEQAAGEIVAAHRQLTAQAGEIRRGAAQLAAARAQFAQLEEQREQFDALEQERAALRRDLEVRQARQEAEAAALQARLDGVLKPTAAARPGLESELATLLAGAGLLEQQETEIAAGRRRMDTLAGEIGQSESAIQRCTAEGLELRRKLDLLQSPAAGDALCPLCQTPLDDDGCHRLVQTYQQEIAAKRSELRQLTARRQQLDAARQQLATAIPQQERALHRQRTQREVRRRELESRIAEAQQAAEEAEQTAAQLQSLRETLASGAFAAATAARLQETETQLRQLGYDDAARRQTYQQTQELAAFALREARLQQAEAQLPAAQDDLSRRRELRQQREAEAARLEQSLTQSPEPDASIHHLAGELAEAERRESAAQAQSEELQGRRGYLQGRVEQREQLAAALAAETQRVDEQAAELSVCQELAAALGRQGVQAMLIETVLPRLEDEANALLGRMTDNRMHLKLESQREPAAGRGEPRETLEVLVSDESGARAYEMYSGGEAFRVNLALRIALSRVLAQRMGAPLPTLFIDEGFGTQDAAGRERIMDVISAIAQDFEKVIVITHLEDLKEAFDIRIEVTKDHTGSTFTIT